MMGKFSGYLICTDYDGTFATKGEPVQVNMEAVQYFIENGGYFTIASGRSVNFLREKELHHVINAPAGLCNGSLVYDYRDEKILRQRYLSCSVREFVEWISPMSHTLSGMNVFMNPMESSTLHEDLLEAVQIYHDKKPLKLLCRFSSKEDADAFRMFVSQLPLMRDYCISKSWSLGVEFNARDASKGHALAFLKESMRDVHTTIGVGNYDNDIPLLTYADIGAAPEDSLNSVLREADMILSPCPEGAIRDLIAKLEKRIG